MTEIRHDAGRGRVELWDGDTLIGHADHRDRDGVRVFHHTVVNPAHEGQGHGSTLVRAALDATREEGLAVRAPCWFVAGWIDRHAEYGDLLAD